MLATTLIGGALAAGSAIAGAVGSARANNKYIRGLQDQKAQDAAWHEYDMSRSWTESLDAQDALRKMQELQDEQTKRQQGIAAVSGTGDGLEAAAAQKEANAKATGDVVATLAADSQASKDTKEEQFRQRQMQYDQAINATEQQKAQNIANAASQAVSAGVNLVGAGIEPGTTVNDLFKKNN